MAKKDGEKTKKKGLVHRMMFGNEDKPDLTPEQMNMSKWAQFKSLFFGRFGTMVLLNLLTLLFAVPAIIVMLMFYLNSAVATGYIPFSSNMGIGYPVVVDAARMGVLTAFNYDLIEALVLIPCIALFAVGLSGNLYVMRKLIWDEPARTFKDFFVGIKKCWWQSLIIGIFFGMAVSLVVFSLGYFDAFVLPVSLKALSVTLSVILLIFMIIFTSFFMTQNAAFKMSFTVLMRNSALFVFGAFLQSVIFIGVALVPVYLAFIPGITMLLAMLYFFIGFSFSTLVISLFCHFCYEKFLYDKITDKPSAAYAKRESDFVSEPDKSKKKQPTAYKNPKKRKKSIDEGSSITPLTPMFRREDLERLQREHEEVMRDSEADEQPDDGQENEQTQATENDVRSEQSGAEAEQAGATDVEDND